MLPFYLYMLRCSDGTYYVGHTDDIDRRLEQHESGVIGGYTYKRRPIELVYLCELPTREEALENELRLKGWSRAKKEALIRNEWGEIKRLARGLHAWQRASTPPGPRKLGPGYAQRERMGK